MPRRGRAAMVLKRKYDQMFSESLNYWWNESVDSATWAAGDWILAPKTWLELEFFDGIVAWHPASQQLVWKCITSKHQELGQGQSHAIFGDIRRHLRSWWHRHMDVRLSSLEEGPVCLAHGLGFCMNTAVLCLGIPSWLCSERSLGSIY